MFAFYVYKIDKQIFKNTRGKSGKFTFIWKYVTNYKRPLLVMHWLVKEARMSPGRTFSDRLLYAVTRLTRHPRTTLIFRLKKFSTNYVYRNARLTLATTYRTVTK